MKINNKYLHHIINESVKNVLLEYEWNGRTPQQDKKSEKIASHQTSWKVYWLLAQRAENEGNKELADKYWKKCSEITQKYRKKQVHKNGSTSAVSLLPANSSLAYINQSDDDDQYSEYYDNYCHDYHEGESHIHDSSPKTDKLHLNDDNFKLYKRLKKDADDAFSGDYEFRLNKKKQKRDRKKGEK